MLRDVVVADVDVFFAHQLDPDACWMAAITAKDPTDRAAFDAHWARILGDDSVTTKTVVVDGEPAGYVAGFELLGKPTVAYWIGKEYWGKGVATAALGELLTLLPARPLYARVAKDNGASRRVLEKCGFVVCGEAKVFANARGAEIDELILELE